MVAASMWILACTLAGLVSRTFSALAAQTGDGAVGKVCLETVAPLQLVGERLQDLQLHLGVGTTVAAHHVVMQRRVRPLVLGHSVVEMGVPHHSQLFEHV